MKVFEYRDLCDELSDAFASYRSAARWFERRTEAERVKKVAKELSAAKCPRAGTDDRGRAERLLDMTAKAMDAHDAECRLADANLAAMAFGKTYLRN